MIIDESPESGTEQNPSSGQRANTVTHVNGTTTQRSLFPPMAPLEFMKNGKPLMPSRTPVSSPLPHGRASANSSNTDLPSYMSQTVTKNRIRANASVAPTRNPSSMLLESSSGMPTIENSPMHHKKPSIHAHFADDVKRGCENWSATDSLRDQVPSPEFMEAVANLTRPRAKTPEVISTPSPAYRRSNFSTIPLFKSISLESGSSEDNSLNDQLGTAVSSSTSLSTGAAGGRNTASQYTSTGDPRLPQDGKMHILLAVTGSASSSKAHLIIKKLTEIYGLDRIEIQLVLTKAAANFISCNEIPNHVRIWRDEDEWETWKSRSDPVIHVELRKWANILIIAPLTANTLGKIALGLCDNLLTNVIRAWDVQYPILIAPTMVSYAYKHPATKAHLDVIKDEMKWIEVLKPVEKMVGSFGDIGMGGMMDWLEIVDRVVKKLGGYPETDEENDEDEDEDEDDESEESTDNDGNKNSKSSSQYEEAVLDDEEIEEDLTPIAKEDLTLLEDRLAKHGIA